jgi:hypothetical protein
MDFETTLRARAAEYDAAIDNLLDVLSVSDDAFALRGIELVEATTNYARALNEASKQAPQEISEHFLQLARNLHIEAPFLIARLTRYREGRNSATDAELEQN